MAWSSLSSATRRPTTRQPQPRRTQYLPPAGSTATTTNVPRRCLIRLVAKACRWGWKWKQTVLASLVVCLVLLNMAWMYMVPSPSSLLPPYNHWQTPSPPPHSKASQQQQSTAAAKHNYGDYDYDGYDGTIPPPRPAPTHHACDHTQGIYHVALGDLEGGVGTGLLQLVLNQLSYAASQQLTPWVHLVHTSHVIFDPAVHIANANQTSRVRLVGLLVGRNATYTTSRPDGHVRDVVPGDLDHTQPVHASTTLEFAETGIWEHYFAPVSDYQPGDRSCHGNQKLYVTMDLRLVIPGLHGYDVHRSTPCWRYDYLPEYRSQPWLGWTEWIAPARARAHQVAAQYLTFLPYLQRAADAANPSCHGTSDKDDDDEDKPSMQCSILGLHIRHSDKAAGRRVVATHEFLPYAAAFVAAGGRSIYVATDSHAVLDEMATTWPQSILDVLRVAGKQENDKDSSQSTAAAFVRSTDTQAVFDLAQHHRTNREVLVEILALSHCHFLVHGYSAVSESAIWIRGLALHEGAVNLEDPDRVTAVEFETVVRGTLQGLPRSSLPQPSQRNLFWKNAPVDKTTAATVPSHTACEGYEGVLWIQAVGPQDAAGTAFFTSLLNQLDYADRHRLLPWVHLDPNQTSPYILDVDHHGNAAASVSDFEMMLGLVPSNQGDGERSYPGPPVQQDTLTVSRFSYTTNGGVWESYFEPVSAFVPGDTSCRDKPLVTLTQGQVAPGLLLHAPGSIRAWRYDGLAEEFWEDSQLPSMRARAAALIRKYYRFRSYLIERAHEVNPPMMMPTTNRTALGCLSVHLRSGDKSGVHRTKITADDMRPYLEAYLAAGGTRIYISTDSLKPLQFMNRTFSAELVALMHTQGKHVVRTKKDWPTHMLAEHHCVNSETVVDILALGHCPVLLHGQSTVSEAALYVNPAVRSVNLEDFKHRPTVQEFQDLLAQTRGGG